MTIGCCVNMSARDAHKIGHGYIPVLDCLGYDYVELPLAQLMELTADELEQVQETLAAARLSCESCNNFFPASIRLTGPEANLPQAVSYAGRAIGLAASLGAKIIVFGSSGAKNVPTGFDKAEAFDQVVQTLQAIAPSLAKQGVTAVIEPICHLEGNLIRTVAEGLELLRAVNRPQVRLLADFYHMTVEGEDPAILLQAGKDLRHVHFADPTGRAWPGAEKPEFQGFFQTLRDIGYQGRVSVEAYTNSFEQSAAEAITILRRYTA